MIGSMQFDDWLRALREDCARHNKLLVLNNKGDHVLESLWRAGVQPSVLAIASRARITKLSNLSEIMDSDG
jgi:hypothetical protein